MDEQYFSIWDIVIIQFFTGSITYLFGSIVFFFTLRKTLINKYKIIMLLLFQLCFSVILSLSIWRYWILDIDIMFMFISIPALIAECITISLTLCFLKKLNIYKLDKNTNEK